MSTAINTGVQATAIAPQADEEPWLDVAPLEPEVFAGIRRRLVLEHCKWDPQVEDVGTLAGFPLVIRGSAWRQLAEWSERLTAESLAAEAEMISRPELLARLGLPSRIRRVLGQIRAGDLTPAAGRVMRFDFHWTDEGWRVSEVNADVPGGFTEASSLTAMVGEHYPKYRPAGDPAAAWVDVLGRAAGRGGKVALISAPGYMEDSQVVAYLGRRLVERGCIAWLADPSLLRWREGKARLEASWYRGPVDLVVRFFQAEWLAGLPGRTGWRRYFRGGKTPTANPAWALTIESKRFPLVWDRLRTELPTWRRLLPETRGPREVDWARDAGWILKPAIGNNGDDVAIPGVTEGTERRRAAWAARLRPGAWIVQRRFKVLATPTPAGPLYPCLGVYTIDGKASGLYGRLSRLPLTDYRAVDAVVLVDDRKSEPVEMGR